MEGSWRKSSYSSGADNCVEMMQDKRGLWTRDSKAPHRGTLFTTALFVAAVKAGKFDR